MTSPVVLAVDGNSLVHRGYHALAHTGTRSLTGEPAWAVRGLLMQLVHAVERVAPTSVVVGFDDPASSLRREAHPAYKAQRPDKLRTLVSQLALADETLRGMGVHTVTPPGLEADDVLASVAARTREAGGHTVVVTSDRDAFALIDQHTSVLRIINGGVEASPMLTPARLELMLGVRPDQYRDFAALRGDPSDNLPGVYGVGPKTAALLLAEFGSAQQAFDAHGHPRLAHPDARANWALNCELMTMRCDLDVGLGSPLPLAAEVVRRAYALCQLPGTQPRALRVLCDVEPPLTDAADAAEDALNWDPTAEWRARRSHPPLPERPRESQLTLF